MIQLSKREIRFISKLKPFHIVNTFTGWTGRRVGVVNKWDVWRTSDREIQRSKEVRIITPINDLNIFNYLELYPKKRVIWSRRLR